MSRWLCQLSYWPVVYERDNIARDMMRCQAVCADEAAQGTKGRESLGYLPPGQGTRWEMYISPRS